MTKQDQLQAVREVRAFVQEKMDATTQEGVAHELRRTLVDIDGQIAYLVREDAYERHVPQCTSCNAFMEDGGETVHGVQMCTVRCAPQYRDGDPPKWMDPNWEGNGVYREIVAMAHGRKKTEILPGESDDLLDTTAKVW